MSGFNKTYLEDRVSLNPVTRARAGALLLSGTVACLLRPPVLAQENALVRIAPIPTEGGTEVYYARDMGFFAPAGLAVDIQTLPNSSAVAAAVASHTVDIGYGNIDVLAALHSKGISTVAIAAANEYVSPGSMQTAGLLLPANSPVRQAQELNGKTIAVGALNSIVQTDARAWIDQHGGDSSTVKFIEVPIPAMPAALEAGRIDAAVVVEPFLGIAVKTNRVLAYGFDSISKHFTIGAWFTTPQWAHDHADLVNRFVAVMRVTGAWANTNPVKSGAIFAKYSKVDPGVIATIARARFGDRLSPSLLQPLIDVSAKYNGFNTFPAQELIYTPAR